MKYTVYQHSINSNASDKAVATFSSYAEASAFVARQRAQESRFAATSRDVFSYYIK